MLQMTSVRTVRSMSYVPLCSCKSSGLSALEQFRDDGHIEIGLFPCPNACPCPTVLLHQGEHVVSTKLTLVKRSNSTPTVHFLTLIGRLATRHPSKGVWGTPRPPSKAEPLHPSKREIQNLSLLRRQGSLVTVTSTMK